MCMTPFNIKMDALGKTVPVPCGKCPECIARRVSNWSFRLMQEEKISTSAYFITLTYDTIHIPISEKGYMVLSKRDLQLFFKRLRKAHGKLDGKSIKYYAVGEYGGRSARPHYHVILFNAKIELIQPAWGLGSIHYGEVSGASVGYTLKYISKPSKIPAHAKDDRIPVFSLMSKGIGANYLSAAMVKWHRDKIWERGYCNAEAGKKIAIPRYYRERIYSDDERHFLATLHKVRADVSLKEELVEDHLYWKNKADRDLRDFEKQNKNSIKRDQL